MIHLLFIGLLLIFMIGLGVLLGSMDIKNIKAEWAKRRCDPTIMFSAFLYKPSSDPRSASNFAADNFAFCVRSLIDDIFKELLAPLLGVFSAQMGAANTTAGIFNSVRNQIGNAFRSFTDIFNDFFETYKRGTMQLSRVTQLIKQSMLKVSAIVVSTVFMGLSLMISLLNTYDFVVKVVIIIMMILVAMIILLFFALIPVMPIIFTTIAVMTAAGLGSALGGASGAFCIDPNAKVLMEDGSYKRLRDIVLGDRLGADCGEVEGILETNTSGPLYMVEGIIMSGSHMVLQGQSYIFASEHPKGYEVSEVPRRLIILNTSSRLIPLLTDTEEILFAKDWEEIPENDYEGNMLWEKLVWNILNTSKPIQEICYVPVNEPLFSKDCEVYEERYGVISIKDVKRGMFVHDIDNNYTEVLGVYKGTVYGEGLEGYTKSVIQKVGSYWSRNYEAPNTDTTTAVGYQIITESGTFQINCKGSMLKVRDFTEVGYKHIDKTYESVRNHLQTNLSSLNLKKEPQQNSVTCASDSSSQACCSCWPQTSS